MDIKNLLKKIIRTISLSFLGVYLPYLIVFTWGFIFQHEPNSLVGRGFINYMFVALLIGIGLIFYSPLITFVLLFTSLLDSRIRQWRFVLLFSLYSGILLVIEAIWFPLSFWYFLIFIIVSLIVVIIFMNQQKVKNLIFRNKSSKIE